MRRSNTTQSLTTYGLASLATMLLAVLYLHYQLSDHPHAAGSVAHSYGHRLAARDEDWRQSHRRRTASLPRRLTYTWNKSPLGLLEWTCSHGREEARCGSYPGMGPPWSPPALQYQGTGSGGGAIIDPGTVFMIVHVWTRGLWINSPLIYPSSLSSRYCSSVSSCPQHPLSPPGAIHPECTAHGPGRLLKQPPWQMPRIASSLCRDVLHEFTTKCTRVQDCLLPEMAKLLELDDDYFINHSAPTPGSTLPSMLEAGSCLRSEASLQWHIRFASHGRQQR
jgi:hypothetical protein